MLIRSPIVSILGHVDHGKTSLLDAIRKTRVAKKEAGGITQMIASSYISSETIKRISKEIEKILKVNIIIPGLLFIDTPGHEAFSSLRERGGSIADIAILIVDINEGFKPQTIESINILKNAKTPFVVVANKIDLIPGWKEQKNYSFLSSFSKQKPQVKEKLDAKVYELMAKLGEFGFDSERFDRIEDFTKQIAIIPASAKTNEGLAEILLLLTGLSQKFLEERIHLHPDAPAEGTILEVKEDKYLGLNLDVIIYDGVLREGDKIWYFTKEGPKQTKVRALLLPNIQGAKEKYKRVKEVIAASGVKILGQDLEGAITGSPITASKEVKDFNLKDILISTNKEGVILKVDSLGSAEAVKKILENEKIPIRSIDIGPVSRKDVINTNVEENKYYRIILAFNVPILDDAKEESEKLNVPIIKTNIIYQLIDQYKEWVEEEKEREKKMKEETLTYPCKFLALPGFFFRMSKPAVFGVRILEGKLKQKTKIMNSKGQLVGEIKEIQHEKKSIKEATKGMEVAVSSTDIVLNSDVKEGDILYSYIPKHEIKHWENVEEVKSIIEEIKKITTIKI